MKKKRKPEIELPLNATPGYANRDYPSDEDIYRRDEKLLFNEEDSVAIIDNGETEGSLIGEDLDVPGADLDNANEVIGNEDEENNYYSLGGDDHHDLEDKHE